MASGSGGACSAVGRAQTDSPVASSAAEHGVGDSSSGAILPPQRECGDETDEDSEGSEEESEDENDSNSDGACSDDGCHSKSGRGHLEASNSNGSAGSADTSETAPGLRSHEPADGVSGPETCLTAAAVHERAAAMFVVGAAAPQASGMPSAAKRATMELVMLAYNAVNELCDAKGEALSKSFANFDRVVALGWLLGDAMGHVSTHGRMLSSLGLGHTDGGKLRHRSLQDVLAQLHGGRVGVHVRRELAAWLPGNQVRRLCTSLQVIWSARTLRAMCR